MNQHPCEGFKRTFYAFPFPFHCYLKKFSSDDVLTLCC
uniref:Uncharacterized protein n=1 Tax=Arundo donax TaxID=35708 RepID=A0A0A8YRL4_ARUDO